MRSRMSAMRPVGEACTSRRRLRGSCTEGTAANRCVEDQFAFVPLCSRYQPRPDWTLRCGAVTLGFAGKTQKLFPRQTLSTAVVVNDLSVARYRLREVYILPCSWGRPMQDRSLQRLVHIEPRFCDPQPGFWCGRWQESCECEMGDLLLLFHVDASYFLPPYQSLAQRVT